MNQNYPEYIIKKLRVFNYLEEDDTSRDAEFQTMTPEEVFGQVMQFDGIIGYQNTMLRWVQDIFKVKLSPYLGGDHQSKEEFVHGLGNLFRAQERADEVVAMRMVDDVVTVYFKDGTTRETDLGSKAKIVADITKRVF